MSKPDELVTILRNDYHNAVNGTLLYGLMEYLSQKDPELRSGLIELFNTFHDRYAARLIETTSKLAGGFTKDSFPKHLQSEDVMKLLDAEVSDAVATAKVELAKLKSEALSLLTCLGEADDADTTKQN